MPGKPISRKNMSHIHAAAEHLHALGANYPGKGGPDTSPIGKADQSLGDQIQAVAHAVAMAGTSAEYPYVEEVFPDYVIIEVGETCYRASYSTADDGSVTLAARDSWVEVEEVWMPVNTATKAGALITDEDSTTVYASIKALGDRTLELRVAWGFDNHKEQFDPVRTDFDLENFPTPPVAYYHGYDAKGKKAPKPVYIGKTIKRENRADGHYLITKLNKKPEADRVWEAALKSEAVVSPATAGHLIRKEPDGTLTYWPIVEVSAWDYADSRKQAHPNSRAFPVLKALYREAGIPLPSSIDTASDSAPETGGDPVSALDVGAVADVSPDEAARIVTREIVAALLAKNTMRTP